MQRIKSNDVDGGERAVLLTGRIGTRAFYSEVENRHGAKGPSSIRRLYSFKMNILMGLILQCGRKDGKEE